MGLVMSLNYESPSQNVDNYHNALVKEHVCL